MDKKIDIVFNNLIDLCVLSIIESVDHNLKA